MDDLRPRFSAEMAAYRELAAQPKADPIREFALTLQFLTPRTPVSYLLIGLNVGLFAWMVMRGVSPFAPHSQDLLAWGADYGPRTTGGQSWRLVTAMFVHIGFVHLTVNMLSLRGIGPFVERLVGNLGFLVLYLVSGIGGSIISGHWHPFSVGAGASGAICGILGGLAGFVILRRDTIPLQILLDLRSSLGTIVMLNVAIGFVVPEINQAAHLGGLAVGFLGGLLLSQPITRDTGARRGWRNLLLLLLGGTGLTIGIRQMPRVPDLFQSEARIIEIDKRLRARYAEASAEFQNKSLTRRDFAQVLQHELLPEWRVFETLLVDHPRLPQYWRSHFTRLREYWQLRLDGWEMQVRALRDTRPLNPRVWDEKQAAADRLLEEMNAGR